MIDISPIEWRDIARSQAFLSVLSDRWPSGIASLGAPQPGALHFIDPKLARAATNLPAGCDLVAVADTAVPNGGRFVAHPMPKMAMASILTCLRQKRTRETRFVERSGAQVADGAEVHPNAVLSPGAVIYPEARIGDRVFVGPNAVVHSRVTLGEGVVVAAGAVIGADGLGFAFDASGGSIQIPHFGGVVVGEQTTIGPNAVICAGTIDPTMIGAGCRIDGSTYVGHNARLGPSVWVLAGSVVGGSAMVDTGVWVNTAAMVRSKVRIGKNAVIGAGSNVMKDVAEGETIMGDVASEIRGRLHREAQVKEMLNERAR